MTPALAVVLSLAVALGSCVESPPLSGAPAPRAAPAGGVAVPTSRGAALLPAAGDTSRAIEVWDLGLQATDASLDPEGRVWVAAPFLNAGGANRELLVVTPGTGQVARRVQLPHALRRPVGVVHGSSRSYVRSDRDGRGFALGVVDRRTGRVQTLVEVEGAGGAFGRGLELVGDTLYTFSTWSSQTPEHLIHSIDPATGRVLGRAPLAGYYAVVGGLAYITQREEPVGPTLSIVDLSRLAVVARVETPDLPLVAASPDGVVLAHWDGGEAVVYTPGLRRLGAIALPPPPAPLIDPVGDGFRLIGQSLLVNPEALLAPGATPFLPNALRKARTPRL